MSDRPNVQGASPVCLDCNKAGLLNCSHFDNCNGVWVYKPSERTYTAAEVALERAALLREAAAKQCEWCREGNVPKEQKDFIRPGAMWHHIYDNWLLCPASATLVIPTDQPALDRHDAELKAQFAAVMEKAK